MSLTIICSALRVMLKKITNVGVSLTDKPPNISRENKKNSKNDFFVFSANIWGLVSLNLPG